MAHPLDLTDHRPWPVPQRPWLMFQRWETLLFAHWPVPPEKLLPLVPDGIELDVFKGQAWLGIVPFRMNNVHPRYLPPVPWLSRFPELNVRTYVKAKDGKPGVLFSSLDAANPLAVATARRLFHLPYFNAQMAIRRKDKTIFYESVRTHKNARSGEFRGHYRPTSDVFYAEPETLEHFLVERYCLYASDKQGDLYRAEVHHWPWPLQHAEAMIEANTVAPFDLPQQQPLLHYSETIDVVVWMPRKIKEGGR